MTTLEGVKGRNFRIPGWLVLIAFTVAVNLFAIWWSQRSIWPTTKDAISWTLPKTFKNLNGSPFDLQKMISNMGTSGLAPVGKKVLLVNIWASWCAPCVAEFPSLVEMAKNLEGQKGFAILALSVDEDPLAAQKFLNSFKVTGNFWVAYDENKTFSESVGTFKLPETYLLDVTNNLLIKKFVGSYDWYDRSMLEMIKSQLSK